MCACSGWSGKPCRGGRNKLCPAGSGKTCPTGRGWELCSVVLECGEFLSGGRGGGEELGPGAFPHEVQRGGEDHPAGGGHLWPAAGHRGLCGGGRPLGAEGPYFGHAALQTRLCHSALRFPRSSRHRLRPALPQEPFPSRGIEALPALRQHRCRDAHEGHPPRRIRRGRRAAGGAGEPPSIQGGRRLRGAPANCDAAAAGPGRLSPGRRSTAHHGGGGFQRRDTRLSGRHPRRRRPRHHQIPGEMGEDRRLPGAGGPAGHGICLRGAASDRKGRRIRGHEAPPHFQRPALSCRGERPLSPVF